MHKIMASVVSQEKIEIIRSQEFMPSKARLKLLEKLIILGPKTAILGPQFCRILVLGPHFWWSGGAPDPPGSAPVIQDWFSICIVKIYNILDQIFSRPCAFNGSKLYSLVVCQKRSLAAILKSQVDRGT